MSVPTAAGGGDPADLQAAFAATLVDEWVRGGVAHAVLCPGSRSTPLAVALADHPGLDVHVRLDERSAGFTALGIGLATGSPALVVTTSGTAAAELHPAVVEADLAGVALVVCTADRPPELRDVGAPQTIDQTRLFGPSVRWFCDPGVPEPAGRPSWRSLASRAVAQARTGPSGPGPVHLNLPFREPLLGDPAAAGGPVPGRAAGRPWHTVVAAVGPLPPEAMDALEAVGGMAPGRRGLIVAGSGCGDPDAVLALADALGWPVLADPRSGARRPHPLVVGSADGILRSARFVRGHAPSLVLRLGGRWVSKVVNEFLSDAVADGARSVVVDHLGRWVDPEHEAEIIVRCDPTRFSVDLVRRLSEQPGAGPDRVWGSGWQRAETAAREVIRTWLDGDAGGTDARMDEPRLAHRLADRLPVEAFLVVSSSMPVRDVEAFAGPRPRPPRVLANRGANGIDGVVSTALGVALGSGRPTVALVGDLAFLHDVSALVRAEDQAAPLTVVVADNGGGGIFSFLAPASALAPATFDRLFGTPQATDVAAVAHGFGWPVADIAAGASPLEFDAALGQALSHGGLSVVRVRLPDRPANVDRHRRINDAIVAAVDEATGPARG
ncbi:MAG: 2-succinyl-5-enolpyruvyl-6-hydroxy-3-cyclohexene-1-carboxylic-acid synthase [Acidimicrobiales bacterium]